MYRDYFRKLQIYKIKSSKGKIFTWARYPEHQKDYEFYLQNNRLFGKTESGWLELTAETQSLIRAKIRSYSTTNQCLVSTPKPEAPDYTDLVFEHLVIFHKEKAIFGCARHNGNGKVRLFLVFGNGKGRVYIRNGKISSWEELKGEKAQIIREAISSAQAKHIPTFHLNNS